MEKATVEKALSEVMDPELNLDVLSLGLIYNIDIVDKDVVKIKMTLTFPGCPYGPALMDEIKEKVMEAGAVEVKLDLTFEPPWEPPDDLRTMMGI